MTTGTVPAAPAPGPYPSVALGDLSDVRMRNGVRVVVLRRPQVPLVHLRLEVPLGDVASRDAAMLHLLPKMLLAGTSTRSASDMASSIQRIGGSVHAAADADHLSVAASAPATRLTEILELLCEIVGRPSFPNREIAGERERVAQEVVQEAADPVAAATRALLGALFPGHPYADPLPSATSVRRAGRAALGRFHGARVRPPGSSLVVVGDVVPEEAVAVARDTLGAWAAPAAEGPAGTMGEPRTPRREGGILVVHRPGAVQSNLRIGMRCAGRHDPAFAALMLATTVFGGSFSSRLVANLRERNGYTYSPRAGIDEHRFGAAVTVRAEVATEVTAKALAEVRYELARMATAAPGPEELESSRRYLTGVVTMASATQAGLAGTLASLVGHDLEPSYLEEFVRELAGLDASAVSKAAARWLAPVDMTTVVVGDADVVTAALAPLDRVEVVGS